MDPEKRLKSAADELNQSALQSSPPPLRPSTELMRPWLAFAAAFAVVLAVFGIPYVLTNFGGGASSDGGPLAGAGSTSTTECVVAESTTTLVEGFYDTAPVPVWQDDIDVIAFLNDENTTGVPPGAHQTLLTEVESWDEVASVSYFDKNDAWLEYQQVFEGNDDLLDIDPAILPASIRIELTDVAHQGAMQSRLEQLTPVVQEVNTAPIKEDTGALGEPSFDTPDCLDPGATTTTVVGTTEPEPTTTVIETTLPGLACTAGELVPPTTVANGDPSYDLTEPVAVQLTAMSEAAAGCNATGLAALASDDITTTFGPEGGPEDIASWSSDDERFTIITELFNMSHGVTEMPDGSALYVWPAAFAYDTWDEIPAAAMDELLRIYSQEELDQISQLGSYGGWRIGITDAGEWIFFVAGD